MTDDAGRIEKKKRAAEAGMRVFDALDDEAKALVHRWGRNAQDRITLLKMSPEQAERDLERKYGTAVRT